jgi:hypothetical protein
VHRCTISEYFSPNANVDKKNLKIKEMLIAALPKIFWLVF